MPDADELELIDYLIVLWKRRGLILVGTFMAALVAFLLSVLVPRAYEAKVTIVSAPVNPENFAEIMRNKAMAAETIQGFNLDNPPYKITVDRFISQVISVKPIKGTKLITLTVTLPDPKLAADVANFLAQKGVELLRRFNEDSVVSTRDSFQQQRNRARQSLENARAALRDFQRTANLESVRDEQNMLLDEKLRLAKLSAEITTEQAGLRAQVEELSLALRKQEPFITLSKSIVPDPALLAGAQEQRATALKALSTLELKGQEVNTVYQDIRKDLIVGEASLAALESKWKDVERKTGENERRVVEIRQRIALAEPKEEELTQTYSLAKQAYESLVRKGDEAALSRAEQTSEPKVVDPALVPREPLNRRVFLKTVIAVIVGVMTLMALAFFLEYLKKAAGKREAEPQ